MGLVGSEESSDEKTMFFFALYFKNDTRLLKLTLEKYTLSLKADRISKAFLAFPKRKTYSNKESEEPSWMSQSS